MKYLVTALAITTNTRRRVGKSWTEVVKSPHGPATVEQRYEREFNLTRPHETCKVIDVRLLPHDEVVNPQGEHEVTIISADRPVEYGTLDGNTIKVQR